MADVYIVGCLRNGAGFGERNLGCGWQMALSEGWTLEEGELTGVSQFDSPADADYEGYVWCQPIEVQLKAVTLASWPQLEVNLFTVDRKGLKQHVACGTVYLPLEGGRHIIEVPCWRVQRQRAVAHGDSVIAPSKEGSVEPLPTSILGSSDRARLLTESAGSVYLDLNIAIHGFENYGVIVSA